MTARRWRLRINWSESGASDGVKCFCKSVVPQQGLKQKPLAWGRPSLGQMTRSGPATGRSQKGRVHFLPHREMRTLLFL